MALYERLILPDDNNPKIPIHQFMAAVAELNRGTIGRAALERMFELRPEDLAELSSILQKGTELTAGDRFEFSRVLHDILLLAEEGLAYTTRTEFESRIAAEPKRPSLVDPTR